MEKLKEKFDWKRMLTIGVATIGFISAVVTIYTVFQDKKASLDYEIISNTNVLDINANVSKLDILYGGASLKSNNQNLRIFYIKIKNNGNENILRDYYDLNDPIGIKIKDGRLIERPEIINTSNNYLTRNLKIAVNSSNEIAFNDLIIEPNQYYIVKLLVLYNYKSNPSITFKGKIAGQNEIQVIHLETSKENKSVWKDIKNGNIVIQAVRFLFYGVIMVVLVVSIAVSSQKINDFREKLTRKKLVEKYKRDKAYSSHKYDAEIFEMFENNSALMFYLPEYIKDNSILEKDYQDYLKSDNKHFFNFNTINKLLESGYLQVGDNHITINKDFKDSYVAFYEYLSNSKVSYTTSIIIN